jgi:drug/metabolite transporter (DMT)-like permease
LSASTEIPKTAHSSSIIGLIAAAAVVIIGAGWQIATRLGVTTTLAPIDLALLRYGLPAIVLLPYLLKVGMVPAQVRLPILMLMVAGAGLPFGLVAMTGSIFAPVAHMGVLIPGGMALGVAFLAWLLLKERYSASRVIGLCILAAAILVLAFSSLAAVTTRTLTGDALFLTAAALWAGYTIAYRKSGLKPLEAAAVISAWSLVFALPVWLLSKDARLLTAPLADVAVQFAWQSVLAGVVAMWAYGVSVQKLGPSNSAALGALLPAASSVGALIFLGEPISLLTGLAICAAVFGVLLSTGWLENRR